MNKVNEKLETFNRELESYLKKIQVGILGQRENIFCKVCSSKYSGLCEPCDFCQII